MSGKKDDAMAATMIPSMITEGQINKATDVLRSQLRKHRDAIPSRAMQTVLGQEDLGYELIAIVRKRVEAVSNIIVRHVKVDRTRTPQQILDAMGLKQHTDPDVVQIMPKGSGEGVDVHFFMLGRTISDAELENEYVRRGLVPADPYSIAAVNATNPAFAHDYPNGTHWQDEKGHWCFAAFVRSGEKSGVVVRRGEDDWDDDWWFAGLRKK